MRWWFTADHHFNHGNIIKYCKRPFKSLSHMNLELIRRWNDKVMEEDKVVYLGDFAFGNPKRFIEQLNGDIIFIKGSHDSNLNTILRSCVIHYGGIDFWCSHEPAAKFKYNLCGHVHEKWKLKRGRHNILNVGVDQWDFYPINIQEITVFLAQSGLNILNDIEQNRNSGFQKTQTSETLPSKNRGSILKAN